TEATVFLDALFELRWTPACLLGELLQKPPPEQRVVGQPRLDGAPALPGFRSPFHGIRHDGILAGRCDGLCRSGPVGARTESRTERSIPLTGQHGRDTSGLCDNARLAPVAQLDRAFPS